MRRHRLPSTLLILAMFCAGLTANAQSPPPSPEAQQAHATITSYDGPATCVACHRDEALEMHGTVHYRQSGPTPYVVDIPGEAGERGFGEIGFNTYCGAHVTSRRSTCAGCHVGNGRFPLPEATDQQLENIDCMMCHQQDYLRRAAPPYEDVTATAEDGSSRVLSVPIEDATGFSYIPDETAMTITALQAAQTAHPSSRATCLRCHAKAGGTDGAKRGDMSTALLSPSTAIDLHMSPQGGNMHCAACHSVGQHRVRGRGLDLRPSDSVEIFECSACHGEAPHEGGANSRLNTHTTRVACQSCHIPTYAKGVSTETVRNWLSPHYSSSACSGQGGWKPEEIHGSDLVPTYRWFDGRSKVYVLETPAHEVDAQGRYLMASPLGAAGSPAAKIYPMKEHVSNSARHDATGQMIPHSTEEYFRFGDFTQAVEEGMLQAGLEGSWSLVDVFTYQTINHGVVHPDNALECGDCHDDPSYSGGPVRLDLAGELGYELWGSMEAVCSQCHSFGSTQSFKRVHEKHVDDRGYDCSTCHEVSRPERALSMPFAGEPIVHASVEKLRTGPWIHWQSVDGASSYDVVRGDLDQLVGSGDLGAGLTCQDDALTSLDSIDDDSGLVDQVWYLVRAVLGLDPATYSGGGAGEEPGRDVEIASDPQNCP